MMRADNRMASLMEALGYRFQSPGLLSLALTHPSATAGLGKDNQRLEFLGDAVLQLCVSEALYTRYPNKREGELTQLRAALVREESLAYAAQKVLLGDYLRFDHGEAMSGGRHKPSVLADAMEAVLAAVYLDGGIEAAKRVCTRALDGFSPPETPANWKSVLQEAEQAKGHAAPVYHVVAEEGPAHARVFHVEVVLTGGERGKGQGISKKQAEQEAARAAMEEMSKS